MNTRQVAKQAGVTTRTVTRIANKHGVGKLTNGEWVFTPGQAARVSRIARDEAGNPQLQSKAGAKSIGRKGGKS